MLRTPAFDAPYGADGTLCVTCSAQAISQSVRSGYLVWPVGGHTCSKHDGILYILLDERPGSHSRTVEGPIQLPRRQHLILSINLSAHVNIPELLNLFRREIKSRLVLGSSSIHHHSMQAASLLDDLINHFGDVVFLGNVGLDGMQLPGMLL